MTVNLQYNCARVTGKAVCSSTVTDMWVFNNVAALLMADNTIVFYEFP